MYNALEIDFLPVGDNSKSGDAIALRFGEYESSHWKSQKVFVIDGGDSNAGARIIEHITEVYKTDKVDRAILTHPDGDHASGLRQVIEELKVEKIWMHRPWNHWPDLQHSIHDNRITRTSFGERLKKAYQYAYEIEQIAKRKKIPIWPSHQGCAYGNNEENYLTVLGPGKDFYLSLIQASDKTPQMGVEEGIAKSFSQLQKESAYENMSFDTEHLGEMDEETSCENDMSLILYLTVANHKVMFTGDAGTMGLFKAIRYAIESGIDLKTLDLLQAPHHGSRHNISKGILEYIHAPKAIISCAAKGEPSHPSKIVTNALHRRGIVPYCTKGDLLCFRINAPSRTGMVDAQAFPFHTIVEIPK